MSTDPQDPKNSKPPEAPDDDLWEEASSDDEVIGRAFRRSIVALLALGLIAVVAFWFSRRPESAEESAIEREAPQRTVTVIEPPDVSWVDASAASGISFSHQNGARGERLLPETMGGGGAFFDWDQDGDQDLLLVDSDRWPRDQGRRGASKVFENDGTGSFHVAQELAPIYGTGTASADLDGDGYPEVFIASVGQNRLYRNVAGGRGGRRLVDVSADSGVAGSSSDWSTSAVFFDYDRDGDLDLFVANYVRWSREIDLAVDYRLTGIGRAYGPPVNYQGSFPSLYRNDGDLRFVDVSQAAGMHVTNSATGEPVAKSLGVVAHDVDQDGWPDLFVANDTVRNFLLHNQGDGTFEEIGEEAGLAYGRDGAATGAMGIDVAWFRNDGDLAIGIGNFANEMTSFYVSQGDPLLFADQAIGEGVGAPSRRSLTFGLFFFDYDLDGRLDLLQVNGHLEEEIAQVESSQSYRQPPQLFWNAGDSARTFLPVPLEGTSLGEPIVGRASSYADVDGDGDLDVLLLEAGGPARLLRNEQSTGHHWLRVVLRGNGASVAKDAIGAVVELESALGTQRRVVMPTRGYQSQVELPVTFGLKTEASVKQLRVHWPDGSSEQVTVDSVDRVLEIEQQG